MSPADGVPRQRPALGVMIGPRALIAARHAGEIRYAVASEPSDDLSRLLGKFGLSPDASLLAEHNQDAALDILIALLWKDMAYEGECMPRHEAESLAHQVFSEHVRPGCRYFSNGNVTKGGSWNPLTESTFDAGLIITDPASHIHLCIWFQDED